MVKILSNNLILAIYILLISWAFNASWQRSVRSCDIDIYKDGVLLKVIYTRNPIQGILMQNYLNIVVSEEQFKDWINAYNSERSGIPPIHNEAEGL